MISKEFITAGKSIFTVELPGDFQQGRSHYTYQVRLKKAKNNYPDTFFVSLLTGPDNTSDYTYIGILNAQTGIVRTTPKSKFPPETFPVRLINRIFYRIWANETEIIESNGYDLHHEGRCGRCGRRLTVPESIETGLGPECAGKVA
jgi:hypothetical protein